MSKKFGFLVVVFSVLAIYFLIQSNGDRIKDNLSWVFESHEEEHALPELSNDEIERNSVN